MCGWGLLSDMPPNAVKVFLSLQKIKPIIKPRHLKYNGMPYWEVVCGDAEGLERNSVNGV